MTKVNEGVVAVNDYDVSVSADVAEGFVVGARDCTKELVCIHYTQG